MLHNFRFEFQEQLQNVLSPASQCILPLRLELSLQHPED